MSTSAEGSTPMHTDAHSPASTTPFYFHTLTLIPESVFTHSYSPGYLLTHIHTHNGKNNNSQHLIST